MWADLRTYLRNSAEPLQATALALPLLLLYGVGIVVLPEARNGADLVTSLVCAAMGGLGPHAWAGYLGFYGLLSLANLLLIRHLAQSKQFSPRYFWAVMGESMVYAVTIGLLAGSWTRDVTQLLQAVVPLAAGERTGPLAGVVMSAGAGLHEELVFRLCGLAGIGRLWLGGQWRLPSLRLGMLLLGTAVLFSAVHHIVEPFTVQAFVFRTFAGLLFGALFLLRGFAVAAWTHALYDIWVIVVLGA
jgi:hypothetical protein